MVLQVRDCWLPVQVVVERRARRDVQQEVRRQSPVQPAVRVEPPQPRRADGGAGWPGAEEVMPRTKEVLVETLHELGIMASMKTLMEDADEVDARRAGRADVGDAVRRVRGDEAGGGSQPQRL